jgi:DNA repair protein SbcD/Mre11
VRFVHTSDWHLGKRLHEASLLEDQAHALEQIVAVCRDERAEALIVAGDLYDRAVPPVEAVTLLSDFVARVARDLRIPIVAISGNHDSPDRLGFAAELLERGQVHLRTSASRVTEPVMLERGRRRLAVYCLPYLEGAADHRAAVQAALEPIPRGGEAVLVAHLFAAGGRESPESERPLLIGGAAPVDVPTLSGWSYVALGHLHEAQAVGGRGDIRYSGSPLKYSFGEALHRKSVSVVDIVCGRAAVREVPIAARRDLVRIEGSFAELLRDPRFEAAEQAYVQAIYTDAGYVLDAAARLRVRYPHLLQVVPRLAIIDPPAARAPAAAPDARGLLAGFWSFVEGEDAPAGALDDLERALARVREAKEPCALAS